MAGWANHQRWPQLAGAPLRSCRWDATGAAAAVREAVRYRYLSTGMIKTIGISTNCALDAGFPLPVTSSSQYEDQRRCRPNKQTVQVCSSPSSSEIGFACKNPRQPARIRTGAAVPWLRHRSAAIGCWRPRQDALIQEPQPLKPAADAVIGPCDDACAAWLPLSRNNAAKMRSMQVPTQNWQGIITRRAAVGRGRTS
ncbi:hypothetical protein BBK36DRAFT_1137532 [Trichoderma citrinoviride]|uniref:Uncharacterized protein n=1 Tax=Trichoderma citrinoviride TaxID=58853 RepID=A0A2T4BNI6_9HYPO|nr:hypothetical protein BBK36DRAFT_1137532 [Trichoderma citrinoviride]PTB70885.1 hypothetical protein BBK36DRAFT_1137532 [Trichoderma citrinoviride]